ncbi:MAG: hypothetical protein JNK78_17475 [Planctomycetes bacterium]|nr:hypothetical protein [Planctomycetota bacterium]
MNLRAPGVLGLCAVLAAALWFALRSDDVPAPPLDAVPAKPTPAPVPLTARERSEATERTAAKAAAEATSPPATERRVVRGTIVAVDSRGVEHPQTNGTMDLDLVLASADGSDSGRVETVPTTVTAGRWEASIPVATVTLAVNDVVLDERRCACDEAPTLSADDAPIALRARWFDPLRLRVVGSDTRADLTEIRVVQVADWELTGCTHPGNHGATPVLDHAVSPLTLPNDGSADTQSFRVHSPGYAWGAVDLSTAETGERELRLVPGGDLDVTILGTAPEGAVLRVRAAEQDSPTGEFRLSRALLRIDGLPVGRWLLTVEKGRWFQNPLQLGKATVEVARGAITPATITLSEPAERPPMVQVQGTLTIDPAWGDDVSFRLEPMKEVCAWDEADVVFASDALTKIGEGRYRWGPRKALAGRYGVVVEVAGYRSIVHVGPHPTTDLDIVVPPPNEVRLRLVDAMTRAPIAHASPSWYFQPPEGWDKGWSHREIAETGDGWYRFLSPAGRIGINVEPEGYAWTMESRDVKPGPNEIEVSVKRVCGVEIVLKDGDVIVPWPISGESDIENVVTKTGVAYWSGGKIAAKEAGEHTLTIGSIDGYEPIPPRKVVIPEGEWTKVEIALRRKR